MEGFIGPIALTLSITCVRKSRDRVLVLRDRRCCRMLDDCLPDLPWEVRRSVLCRRCVSMAKRIRLKRVFGMPRYMLQKGRLELR